VIFSIIQDLYDSGLKLYIPKILNDDLKGYLFIDVDGYKFT